MLSAPLTAQQKELYDAVINRSLRTFLLDKQDKHAESQQSDSESEEEEAEAEESEEDDEPARKRRRTSGRGKSTANGKANGQKSKSRKTTDDSESDSSEDEALANTSRRSHVQRRNAKRDYAERTDAQFFKEADAGTSTEIKDYGLEDSAASRALSRTASTASTRELRALEAKRGVNQLKLQNVVMQLRKVCNHPWLFDWPVDRKTGEYVINEGLIAASGKMLLLDRLLGGLFERGHKVLLFSQCSFRYHSLGSQGRVLTNACSHQHARHHTGLGKRAQRLDDVPDRWDDQAGRSASTDEGLQ